MGAPHFTSGPWFAERREHCSVVRQSAVRDSYSSRVAECPQWSPAPHPQPTPDEAFANARLIAAAPELYEAVRLFVEEYDQNDDSSGVGMMIAYNRALEAAKAALAKARGETA
jgi:hypothetical protein